MQRYFNNLREFSIDKLIAIKIGSCKIGKWVWRRRFGGEELPCVVVDSAVTFNEFVEEQLVFHISSKLSLVNARKDAKNGRMSITRNIYQISGLDINVDLIKAIREDREIRLTKSLRYADRKYLEVFVEHCYLALLRRYPAKGDVVFLANKIVESNDIMLPISHIRFSDEFSQIGYRRGIK